MSHLAASALLALAPSAGQNSATTRRICPLSLSLSSAPGAGGRGGNLRWGIDAPQRMLVVGPARCGTTLSVSVRREVEVESVCAPRKKLPGGNKLYNLGGGRFPLQPRFFCIFYVNFLIFQK